jgi:hypothetical protein
MRIVGFSASLPLGGGCAMSDIRELFELARNYYLQANRTADRDAKLALQELGEKYLRAADNLRRYQIIQARVPQTDPRSLSK